MRKPSPRTWLLSLLVLCGATLIARQLSAEIPTVKGIGKVGQAHSITITATNGQVTTLVTAPGSKAFILTDVVFSNPQTVEGRVDLLDVLPGSANAPVLRNIMLQPKQIWDHLFGTGIEIAGGHELRVLVSGTAPIEIFVSGYFRK